MLTVNLSPLTIPPKKESWLLSISHIKVKPFSSHTLKTVRFDLLQLLITENNLVKVFTIIYTTLKCNIFSSKNCLIIIK